MSKPSTVFIPAYLSAAVFLALSGGALSPAQAQDTSPAPTKTKDLTTVIVTGTRSDSRTESSSLTPIDVVSAKMLQQTGTNDLPAALARVIPSLTFPRPSAADTADTQRPAQLRGLSPDQVLVLVNGKRWHPGALLLTNGVLGRGAQAVDLNTIPVSAIDHIEVLRDGASAQYGSDAIAGVINIILKKGAKGGDVEITGGQYSAGDGRQWQGSANFGIPLSDDKGWIRFTVQSGNEDYTNRAGPDTRPGFPQLGVNYREGDPAVKDQNLLINTQYDITPDVQFYAFGHFGHRDGTSPAFFRYGSNSPKPSSPLIAGIYPNGYLPLENSDSTDRSLVAGLRGTVDGWRWDVSANVGGNRVAYETQNSINLAYLNDFGSSPSTFRDGTLKSGQQSFDIDIAKDLSVGWLPNPVTVAFGTEYLRQSYEIDAGDLASYYTTGNVIPGTTTIPAGGAQGFAGWQPANAGSFARHDVAEYVDLETNLTDRLGVSAAVRHENYSDFGGTTSGSLAGRFDFTDRFALRASASTGFRAPSLAQQYYSSTSSLYYGEGNSLRLPAGIYNSGLVPVNSPVAKLLGSEPLKPEKSHNYTIGAVWNPTDALSLSIDAYQIAISNRVVLSSSIATTGAAVQAYLAANGVSNLNYSGVSYFTNAADTRTRGVDVVTSYRSDFGNAGTLQTTLSANYNKNKVTDVKPNPAVLDSLGTTFHRLDRRDIKGLLADTTPRSKLILSEQYNIGNWGVTGTVTRYGRYTAYSATNYLLDQTFTPKWIFDIAVNYSIDQWTFTVGADDALDTYPNNVIPGSSNNGTLPYSVYAPFGYNGAYVYGKVRYSW